MTYPGPILVVDRESDSQISMIDAIRKNGYSIESASTGTNALHKIKSGQFSVMITDEKIPEMSGMELLYQAKKISPQISVIITTDCATVNNAVKAIQEGASDYMLKPVSVKSMGNALKKVISKRNDKTGEPDESSNLKRGSDDKKIITKSPKLFDILKLSENVAPTNSTILIQGESGTGKELLAMHIHKHSRNATGPYVAVNCAALPETLAESELFGHEKGAFTGALKRKPGKFELANHGTMILDEISEMPMLLQAKLLRVLQERKIDSVGGGHPIDIDTRIIAISNKDLRESVNNGKFREDLFYRVHVINFTIPSLRERKEDIPLLSKYFMDKYTSINNRPAKKITDQSMSLLVENYWQGNVRELENVIERAVLLSNGDHILPDHLYLEQKLNNTDKQRPVRVGQTVREMEQELIYQTLKEVNDNRTHAAEMLGVSIRTLRNKLKEYREQTVKNPGIEARSLAYP